MASTLPHRLPPIGADDQRSASVAQDLWKAYQAVRRPWLLEVEDNVRMLSGRQFDEFIPSLGQYENITDYFVGGGEDQAWRDQPAFNWVGHVWFPAILGKLTENTPQLGAIPATSDQRDAATAQIFDPVFRYEWAQMGMERKYFMLYAWVLCAARGILWLRWDPRRGPSHPCVGPADIPMPDGSVQHLEACPYAKNGDGVYVPAVAWDEAKGQLAQHQPMARQWEGDLAVEVPAPTSILLPYGPEDAHEKPWVMREYLMHVDEVKERWGVEVEPDSSAGVAQDLLYALSYSSAYGMPTSWEPGQLIGSAQQPKNVVTEGLTRVREYWSRETATEGNGRLLIQTQGTLLEDGENPYVGDAPLDRPLLPCFVFDRPGFPWRQEGTTDLEAIKSPQRAINRRMGAVMDAVDYFEQPTRMVNSDAVADDEEFGKPGGEVRYSGAAGEPAFYLNPPALPAGSIDMVGVLRDWCNVLGHINAGDVGQAVSKDPSGELQRQVRYDNDRPWGTTLRLHNGVWGEFGKAIIHLLGVGMRQERLLAISGEDNAATFLNVGPEMFQGRINVIPVMESSVLESRQDKQNRIRENLAFVAELAQADPTGGLGRTYSKAIGQPDVARALRPGGEAYSVQVREIVEMTQSGVPAQVLPDDDDQTHLLVLRDYQQTMGYRREPPPVQAAIALHAEFHEANARRKLVKQAVEMAQVQAAIAVYTGEAQTVVAGTQAQVTDAAEPPGAKEERRLKLEKGKPPAKGSDSKRA